MQTNKSSGTCFPERLRNKTAVPDLPVATTRAGRMFKYSLDIVDRIQIITRILPLKMISFINKSHLDIVPYLNYSPSYPDFRNSFANRIEQHTHTKPGYTF